MAVFTITRGLAKVGRVQLANGVVLFDRVSPPVDGVTGKNWAPPGSVCFRTNGDQYTNTGTTQVPVWTPVFMAQAKSASVSPSHSHSPSSSHSPSASASPS